MAEKVILAFSGGLDTSIILKWLIEQGYKVVTYTANLGQQENLDTIKKKALALGASKAIIEDVRREFVEEFVFQALKANAVYEGRYLLGTALARPLIAKKQVEVATKIGTNLLAHGCTAKGNDQIRFELTWKMFMPEVKTISPWKDTRFISTFKGRKDMIAYAKRAGINIPCSMEKPYSVDENIAHMSYESGILENPMQEADENMFKKFVTPKKAKDEQIKLMIEFEHGTPCCVTNLESNEEYKDCVEIMEYLNTVGASHGIGIVDMVENRFIGIKSRGVYIAPAATILWKAHQEIESLTLDKEVFHLKEMLSLIIGRLIYNGFWYAPEMDFLMAAINQSQQYVSGRVYVTLYKGNVMVRGRESKYSRYSQVLASMDSIEKFEPKDAAGFINTLTLRLKGAKA
jgi:argininosuccinate synthase